MTTEMDVVAVARSYLVDNKHAADLTQVRFSCGGHLVDVLDFETTARVLPVLAVVVAVIEDLPNSPTSPSAHVNGVLSRR